MRFFSSSTLLTVVAAVIAGAAVPADAAAKCRKLPGMDVLPGALWIVDGKVVADLTTGEKLDEKLVMPDRSDIFSIQITCLDVTTPGASQRTMRSAVVIFTKSGLPDAIKGYLQQVADAQRAHHARTGSYTAVLSDIDVEQPLELQLELKAGEAGWSASVTVDHIQTVCSVAVGPDAPLRADQKPGVPACFPTK